MELSSEERIAQLERDIKNLASVFTDKLSRVQQENVLLEAQLKNARKTSPRSKSNEALKKLLCEAIWFIADSHADSFVMRARALGVNI